jgi:sigma-B regulation protein RsbU (phosphoserine phosphatase)
VDAPAPDATAAVSPSEELARREAEIAGLRDELQGLERRRREELRLAGNVQRALLPGLRSHDGLELAREFLPFHEVGGDYYDVVELPGRRLALAIGDVMGKGVAAALLVASLKSALRAELRGGESEPAALMARVNRLFFEVSPRGRFATFFVGMLDLASFRLDFVNAGHEHPFVVRADGSSDDLAAGGTVLGFSEDATYEAGHTTLQRGDLLVLFTDGVTDRDNALGESFGAERLKQAAAARRHDPARIALYSLLGEVQGWSSGSPAEDDMTLLVAKPT